MTNLVAKPPVMAEVPQWGGRLRVVGGAFEMDSGIVATDIIRLARLPVNARVWKIELGADNLGSAAAFDVGIYDTDGTVRDVNMFASALVLDAKVYAPDEVSGSGTQIVYEAAITDIVHNGKALWDRAGVASNPGGEYDVSLTATTITSAVAGTIAYTIYYTVT